MLCALTRSFFCSQVENALVILGKPPDSPAPKRNSTTTKLPKFQTSPVIAVKEDHQITTRRSTLRGPSQSPIHPPGISKSA